MKKSDGVITIEQGHLNYVAIDYGDGVRCAWCNKPTRRIKDFNKHTAVHEKKVEKLLHKGIKMDDKVNKG